MSISHLYFLFGLLISLQQLTFLSEKSKVIYMFFACSILLLNITIIAILKGKIKFIKKKKTKLNLFFNIYVLLVIISIYYFFERSFLYWFLGLIPFIITIPFFKLSTSIKPYKNILSASNLWLGVSWGCFIVLLITILLGEVNNNRIRLDSISPSVIGLNAAILIIISFSHLLNKSNKVKYINYIFILTAIIALLLSTSKSSVLGLLIVFILLTFRLKLLSLKNLIIVSFFALIIISLPVFKVFQESIKIAHETSSLETFTGRTLIWENIRDLIIDRPYFGYGYNSPALLLTAKHFDIWGDGRDIIQAHNMWYQSMLNLGVVGTVVLGLIIILFYSAIGELFYHSKELYVILLSTFTFLLIRGFTESSITNGYSFDVFLFLIIIQQTAILIRPYKAIARHRRQIKT